METRSVLDTHSDLFNRNATHLFNRYTIWKLQVACNALGPTMIWSSNWQSLTITGPGFHNSGSKTWPRGDQTATVSNEPAVVRSGTATPTQVTTPELVEGYRPSRYRIHRSQYMSWFYQLFFTRPNLLCIYMVFVCIYISHVWCGFCTMYYSRCPNVEFRFDSSATFLAL